MRLTVHWNAPVKVAAITVACAAIHSITRAMAAAESASDIIAMVGGFAVVDVVVVVR